MESVKGRQQAWETSREVTQAHDLGNYFVYFILAKVVKLNQCVENKGLGNLYSRK